jgi:hypothetical protein
VIPENFQPRFARRKSREWNKLTGATETWDSNWPLPVFVMPDPCLRSRSNSPHCRALIAIDGLVAGTQIMGQPTVILIGADKGGVGKTTVARTLLDYITTQEIPTRAFDTEAPKGALHRFHPKITEIVDVTEVSGQMRIFDTVSDSERASVFEDDRAVDYVVRIERDTGMTLL